MQDIIEKIALCVELGKINSACPFPPDMQGQDGAVEIAAEALKLSTAKDVRSFLVEEMKGRFADLPIWFASER